MAKTLLDFLDDDSFPEQWGQALLNVMNSPSPSIVESEKLRMQMSMVRAQSRVTLYIDEQADRRAQQELEAAHLRSEAADRIAGSLRFATWVLAGATVVLAVATAVLAVRPG